MKFESSQIIPFPIEQVFQLVRDQLEELVPFLPNVNKIEMESEKDEGNGKLRILNRWHGKGEIPKVAQKLVSPDKLTWLDTAVWDDKERTCQWEITPMFFQGNVACKGINYYREEGENKTLLQVNGDLTIQAKGIRGVPRLLEKKVSAQIEKFVVRLLTPNLDSLAQGVTQYLQQKQEGA